MVYKHNTGIKKCQLFRMTSAHPNVVRCRRTARTKILFQYMRRNPENTTIRDSEAVDDIFTSKLPLTPPPLNVENITTLANTSYL